MSELAAEIREAAARYPDRRSAILPALRLAQERYGWLSPEALEEVADALDYTPAFCLSIASFYDMFHLEPVGRHLIEVCTNVCCGLLGAQGVLEAFERELGVAPGETSEDNAVTLRAVECQHQLLAIGQAFGSQFWCELQCRDARAVDRVVFQAERVVQGAERPAALADDGLLALVQLAADDHERR